MEDLNVYFVSSIGSEIGCETIYFVDLDALLQIMAFLKYKISRVKGGNLYIMVKDEKLLKNGIRTSALFIYNQLGLEVIEEKDFISKAMPDKQKKTVYVLGHFINSQKNPVFKLASSYAEIKNSSSIIYSSIIDVKEPQDLLTDHILVSLMEKITKLSTEQ